MIREPVLIIGCPRSGTTLLFNVLSEVPAFWSIGYESKEIIERYHHPRKKNWESGVLDASDLTSESRAFMLREFAAAAAPGSTWEQVNRLRAWLRRNQVWQGIKRRGRTEAAGSGVSSAIPGQGLDAVRRLVRGRNRLTAGGKREIRLLEKTPENCLRLPFLLALFPDARVIYLTRDARSNVNSLIEGWRQPHLFPGYQVPEPLHIPGYTRDRWAFTLIPGWRELASARLEEICASQWVACNEAVMAHRAVTANGVPYLTIRYEDLTMDPEPVLRQVAAFSGVPFEGSLARHAARLPRINVVSAPQQEKWRRENREEIERILPLVVPGMERLGYEI
jgi:LPS sulfotransferase NodH